MGPLTSFLLSQLSEESVDPLVSKLAEKTLTPAEVSRLAEDLVAEWQTDPELKARSLALIGKRPKETISHRDLEMMVRLLHATHSKDAGAKHADILPEFIAKAKRDGFIDPRTDDFSKNQAFGRSIGIGLLPLFTGAVLTPTNPKIGLSLAAAGLGGGALTYGYNLKKFRELQAKGLNPATGKKHDPARIERTRQLVQRIRKNKEDRAALNELDSQVFEDLGIKQAEVEYHGKTFPGYNKPIASDKKDKKMMVLAKKGDEVKLVHFGQKGYQHNYSPEAKQNYLTRSAGIRNKSGQLTKDDPFSPNYWARKVLWPKGETGHGHNGPVNTEVRMQRKEAGLKEKLVDLLAPAHSSDPRIRAEGEFRAKNDMVHGGQFLGQFRGNYKERMQDYVDKATTQEKKAGLFDTIAARKENERWAAAAKLAADDNFGHGAELAGLGILAVPAAASVIGKKFKMPSLHRFGERDAVKHTTELVGLGTLAAPSVSHFLKNKSPTSGQQ
jgi:uncharacterized protein YjiS (DUF1127 family)